MTERLPTVTSINGELVPADRAVISVFDNSLLYAEGLFETFLAIGDDVVFGDEHLDRLYRGADVIGLEIPADRDTLRNWMRKTLRDHPSRIKKLRLTHTSGESARWIGVQGEPTVILSASPHELPTEPFKLHVSDFRVDQDSVFRQIKTISYAIHAAALGQAKRQGVDDALLLNERDEVAEVTSANIFWIDDGHIYTPPLSAGCLDGITRKVLLREAASLGLTIEEKLESLKGLCAADEIFISSSLKLVVGVSEIVDASGCYHIAPGEVTQRINDHFRKLVGL